jgi:O-antigen/teichoic acid export membrane protein
MLSLNRTKVMSIPEFLQECERERLEKQYNLTNLDKIIGHIKRNKRLYRRLVFNVALTCLLMNIDLSIAYASVVNVDDAIRKIEEITDQLLKLAQVVGSSVNLVFVFKNVVGEIFRGNGNISKPVLNYIWIQLVLFFLPTLGDIISSIADN